MSSLASFEGGDGVVVVHEEHAASGRIGTVAVVESDVIVVDFEDGKETPMRFAPAELNHMVPSKNAYKPGWWPYEPTSAQREDFATWARDGLTVDKHGVNQAPGWQKKWNDKGCGDWCCYSFECGAIKCDACNKTAVWPTCPNSACRKSFAMGFPPGSECDKCGTDLTSVDYPTRYVCEKQVGVKCGLNGDEYLFPTYCATYCGMCFHSGLVRHEHGEFLQIDPSGKHTPGVKLETKLDASKLQKEAMEWKDALCSLCSASFADNLPPTPEENDGQLWLDYISILQSPAISIDLILQHVNIRVVASEEPTRTDPLLYVDMEVGDEFVSPFPCCECSFLVDTFKNLLKNVNGDVTKLKCPMQCPTHDE